MPESVVVVIDPLDRIATRFIEIAHQSWGLRSVCLFTGVSQRLKQAGTAPRLPREAIAATYRVRADTLREVAPVLARRHDVVATLPQGEDHVALAGALSSALGIDWVPQVTLARFRDKASLKEHLRTASGAPRVNASRRVASPADVRAAADEWGVERFVLKPNDGTGNSDIGFFGPELDGRAVDAYFRAHPTSSILMEEFLDGPEYCVNGQVDACGRATTLSVFRTHHTCANGRSQLASSFELIAHSDPRFGTLADYAAAVIGASGLVRSPFHLELIVDDRGPCLVEVAARMAGAGMAFDTNRAHGGSLDVFELAVAHYLGRTPCRAGAPNWRHYDSLRLRTVAGIHHVDEWVSRIDGVAEVEAMPDFSHWVVPPRVGQRLHPTVNLLTIPWQGTLVGSDAPSLEAAEAQMRSALVVNGPAPWPRRGADRVGSVAARLARQGRGAPELLTVRPHPLVAAP